MKHGKPYYAVSAKPHTIIGREARKEAMAKHRELTRRRFDTRDEAEANMPDDDRMSVVESIPVSLGVGGF